MFTRSLLRPSALALRAYSTAPAPTLEKTLRSAMMQAMKAKDSQRVTVIKSVLADLQTQQHTGTAPAKPEKTLARSISSRIDAAATFKDAGRDDLASQYLAEADILKEFAPKEAPGMSAEDLDKVVQKVMTELGLESVGKEMGRVIKLVVEVVEGKAGGKEIAEAVKRWKKI